MLFYRRGERSKDISIPEFNEYVLEGIKSENTVLVTENESLTREYIFACLIRLIWYRKEEITARFDTLREEKEEFYKLMPVQPKTV